MHMIRLLFLIFTFVSLHFLVYGQKSAPGILVICPGSEKNVHSHIPTQSSFENGRTTQTATFDVEYIGFSDEARIAFQYAVNIWQTRISSSIPIKIRATWTELDQGILGSAGAELVWQNFEGAPKKDTWYPVALAEKLSRTELNSPEDADIAANFNSGANWYLGTDGNTPRGTTDFVTVVLHEIAHGLGFVSSMEGENNQGSWGISGSPLTFDHHIENQNGQQLINTSNFSNGSTALYNQLTSNNIYFDGPVITNELAQKPKLFAPSPYDIGSSISHLDENTYPAGTLNSLMTPNIANAEAVHEPGPILMEMFAEMGWESTYIDVSSNKDVENTSSPFLIRAKIISENDIIPASLKLTYSTNNFLTQSEAQMLPTGVPNEYSVSAPATLATTTVSYYIFVDDEYGREFSTPSNAPGGFHQFKVGPDFTPPVIVHEAIEMIVENELSVTINAEVIDNTGLKDVIVEYLINDVPETSFKMVNTEKDEYVGTFIFQPGRLEAGDKIRYRIIAIDAARNANTTYDPARDYHSIYVREVIVPVVSYINNFFDNTFDFEGTGFSITTPPGFNDPAIHSPHPYGNGMESGNQSTRTYQLQVPIIVEPEKAIMRYKEIVLVEPGEEGSIFGEPEFFDYVVVEGSNDNGLTWLPLAPGYDSRKHPVWLQAYNSDIVGDDSQAEGNPSLFREDSVDLKETFSTGDIIFIRFRMYSDQAANGWGWAIDDLNIQGELRQLKPGLSLRPNPTSGSFFIEIPLEPSSGNLEVSVLNAQGKLIYTKAISFPTQNFIQEMNISSSPPGVYIVKIKAENFIFSKRLLLLK